MMGLTKFTVARKSCAQLSSYFWRLYRGRMPNLCARREKVELGIPSARAAFRKEP